MNFSDGWFPFASDAFPVVSCELPRNVSDHLKPLHTAVCPFLPEYRMALIAFCGNDPAALELLESAPAMVLMLVLSFRFNPSFLLSGVSRCVVTTRFFVALQCR